jgi:hypothetical protein
LGVGAGEAVAQPVNSIASNAIATMPQENHLAIKSFMGHLLE